LAHHTFERAHRHRDERRLGSIERLLGRLTSAVEGTTLDGGRQSIRGSVSPRHLGAEPFPCAQPDRAADQTDPHDGDPHSLPTLPDRATLSDSAGEPIENLDRRLPVDTAVGDRLAVDEVLWRAEPLLAADEERLG